MDKAYIIKKPVVTEKSLARHVDGTYSFIVHNDANKFDIARAITSLFKVTVKRVTILNRKGKEKRVFKKRHTTVTPVKKIAIVTIDKKQKIDIFSEFDAQNVEAEKQSSEKTK